MHGFLYMCCLNLQRWCRWTAAPAQLRGLWFCVLLLCSHRSLGLSVFKCRRCSTSLWLCTTFGTECPVFCKWPFMSWQLFGKSEAFSALHHAHEMVIGQVTTGDMGAARGATGLLTVHCCHNQTMRHVPQARRINWHERSLFPFLSRSFSYLCLVDCCVGFSLPDGNSFFFNGQ